MHAVEGKAERKVTSEHQERVEEHLRTLGEWKFNLINGAHMFREAGDTKWQCFNKRLNNTITRGMAKANWKVGSETIDKVVESDFSPEFNPIIEWFEDLPIYQPEEGDHIALMANCLTSHIGDRFTHYFKKWMVASVANVYEENRCTNHLCMTLLGKQGDGKSTFLNALIPTSISEYCYAGRINFHNDMQSNIWLSQNFIVHIEEVLSDLMEKNENDLKEFITRNKCNYVRKYENVQREWPRLANICASLNQDQFLSDSTGDRRYLVLKILNVNLKALEQIDVIKLWSQALDLYRSKYQYWLDDDENTEMQQNNQQFRVVSEEAEMLAKMYHLHTGEDAKIVASHRYTASELANTLRQDLKKHSINNKSVAKALSRMGIEARQEKKDGRRYYYFTPIEPEAQESEASNPHQNKDLKADQERKRKQKEMARQKAQSEEKPWKGSYGQSNEFDN